MKNTREIILIRHGETSYNSEGRFIGKTDIGLNRKGRSQARKLRKKLGKEEADFIISSDLTRCRETADIIFTNDIKFTNELREMDFGLWEGLTFHEISERYEKDFTRWKKNWVKNNATGGESFSDMNSRVIGAMEKLLKKKFTTGVVVTHGGCIRSILGHYILGSPKESWRFQIDNGSVTRLNFYGDYAYLKSLNEK